MGRRRKVGKEEAGWKGGERLESKKKVGKKEKGWKGRERECTRKEKWEG